jgi:hypothetical protein
MRIFITFVSDARCFAGPTLGDVLGTIIGVAIVLYFLQLVFIGHPRNRVTVFLANDWGRGDVIAFVYCSSE